MKKLTCILLVICFSLTAFAKGSGRRYVASVDNNRVVNSQKAQRASLKNFSTGKRYSVVTRGHGFHPFRRRSGGGSGSESGLGL